MDTIMAARRVNTENEDIVFQLGGAARSPKRAQHICAKPSADVEPLQSQTPGLLFPSCVSRNELFNISELHISKLYISLCVKKVGYQCPP